LSIRDSNGENVGPSPQIGLYLNGEGCWPDLAVVPYTSVPHFEVAVHPDGTTAGRPVISIRVEDDDGHIIIAQTSLRLFAQIAKIIVEKYGEE
jgi:hypothetical protein